MRKEARAMGARFKTEGITLKKGDLIMALTSNQHVLDWVKEMEELMTPDKTIWIDGSEGQLRALREQAFATGELTELNQEELPGCVLHHTAKNDVARVEDRTFICTSNKADDCMMVNWMDPNEMKAKLLPLYKNVMAGRTMYVIPYCMGPIGSPFSKVGVEVTDSIYVVLNMDIMTCVSWAIPTISCAASMPVRTSTRRTATSSSSPRTTPSGPSTPATAETCCWAKNASHCASPATRATRKAGWPSTC